MTKHEITMNQKGQLSFSKLSHELIPESLRLPEEIIPKWNLITTIEAWQKALKHILQCSVIGLDIETSGLDPHTDQIRLVQIAISNTFVYILDMNELKDITLLKPVLVAKKPIKIIHNASFELRFLAERHGLVFGRIFDTMLASQMCYSGLHGYRHNLQAVVLRELGYHIDKTLQLSHWMSKTLSQDQYTYAALDAALLIPIREKLVDRLVQTQMVKVAKMEFDCAHAIAAMMYQGLYVDQALLNAYTQQLKARKYELEKQLQHNWAHVNLNSPQQVLKFLHRLGIHVSSTKEEVLRAYADQHPLIDAFFEYKSVSKKLSSTLQPLNAYINPKTKRVHPSFHQIGAVGGRMSCSRPNLQNIPRGELREIFAAPSGYKLIISDYSQIELRIIAEMSRDKHMTEAYQKGEDLHKRTAALLAGKEVNQISKEERQKAKAVNFGLVYGMGAKGLVAYAQKSFGVNMDLSEATQIHHSFFKMYDGLAAWHRKLRQEGDMKTYNQTLSGRKRFYNSNQRYATELYNMPVQGTGADILKAALVRLHRVFLASPIKIVNCVHDEIVIECPEANAEYVSMQVEAEMIAAGEQFLHHIPLAVDVKIADSWAEK